jgi:hypothetical protein
MLDYDAIRGDTGEPIEFTRFVYDDQNRLIRKESYSGDYGDTLEDVITNGCIITNYEYDANGNCTYDGERRCEYDDNNKLISETPWYSQHPKYYKYVYALDEHGNERLESCATVSCDQTQLTVYQYHHNGRLKHEIHTSGGHFDYERFYDEDGKIVRHKCDTLIHDYKYDDNGKLMTLIEECNGQMISYEYAYEYDSRGSAMFVRDSNGKICKAYDYDEHNRCIAQLTDLGWFYYQYDEQGNKILETNVRAMIERAE